MLFGTDPLPNGFHVRRVGERDLSTIAHLNAAWFTGNRDNHAKAFEWVHARFRSFPLYHYFVVETENEIVGYVGWEIKGGFCRPTPVLELEQIRVKDGYTGQGLGTKFLLKTLEEMVEWMRVDNPRIESHIYVSVWGYAANLEAQGLYGKLFSEGIKGMCDLYSDRVQLMHRAKIPVGRPAVSE